MGDIAVVGLSCRFPEAENKEKFWDLLINSKDVVKEIPNTRWNHDLFYSEKTEKGKTNTKYAGLLENIDAFDASFFNMTEEEAKTTDPQQRLLLELTYEALEDAGITTQKIKGEKAGVFIGVSSFDYSHLNFSDINKLNMYSVTGSALSVTANRLSYLFDLKGPSIAIDTACSSSLTAIHLACQSIANNESSIAIVGGVNLIISPSVLIAFSQAQTTSPDGKCKAFDADANGMVRGEGGGIVILKPIEKAIQDNDYIYGIIKGSAVNQDGLTNGLSAPSPAGQRAVLEQAYNNANIDPNLVDFVETHGTGTVLGDPIEADALGKVLGNNRTNTCKIGSVKTNIGHLEASAGIAGFIKTVLCLDKKYLVPSLHFNKPNPYINFEKLNLEVQTKVEKIEKEKVIAGVSSFGFGGTNAHVVVESFDFGFWTSQNDNDSVAYSSILGDDIKSANVERLPHSVRNDKASQDVFGSSEVSLNEGSRFWTSQSDNESVDYSSILGDDVKSANVERLPHSVRNDNSTNSNEKNFSSDDKNSEGHCEDVRTKQSHTLIANSIQNNLESKNILDKNYILPLSANSETSLLETIKNYSEFLKNEEKNINDLLYTITKRKNHHKYRTSIYFKNYDELINKIDQINENDFTFVSRRKPKLVFVLSGMGSQQPDMAKELLQHPVFYNLVEKIDQIMTKYHDWSLLDEIQNSKEQNIERVQPILFSLQLGLAELFKYYGISPDRVIGSSVGEVAGAYISGALSLEDAVKVICIRNKAMCSMIGTGCMAIVKLNESDTANFIKDFEGIYISAVNSPTTTILSGTEENITKVLEAFKSKDIWARIVKGAEAPSHCELMEPVKNYLLKELADITPIKSNISMFSTFTTQEVKGEDLGANYWWENVLKPIELKKTIENLEQKNNCIYVELSPHPVLTSFIKETCQSIDKNSTVLASLSRDISELEQFFTTLGKLYQHGFEINWDQFFTNGKLISLPNYAWDKESYWQDYSQDNTSKVSLGLTTRYKTDKKVKVENYELNNEILENTPTEKRKELISNYLRYHVSRVLKVPFNEIKADEPLKNLGIGSLMGMELYNKLKSDLQITLTISKFLKGISINEISEEILLSKGLTQQNRLKTSTKKNEIPLSFSQQRLLFIQQLQKGVIAYNIPACLKIEGNLNPEFIEKAVNKIIERHEILRTEFNISSGKSSMKVKDSLILKVKQVDALGKTDDEIQELMREDSSIPFNFAESLLRTTIFKQSEQNYYILLTIHHIIADGFSLRVFFSELSQIYISLQENIEIDLPSLPIQYSDYAIWQQEQINKGIYEKQITYWKNQLDNLPSYNLPFDRPRKDVQTFKGEQLQFVLDDNLYTKIQNFSKKQGVTNFVTLLTAYKTLLYHFANQNDIIIGTPIAGRNEPEFENMIGLFLNMLALRSELKGTKTFNELLQEVSKTTLDAYDNQDVPFEKIVEVINPERSLSHTPVFQTIMALHASVDAIDTANLKINYTDVDMKTSKFDLVLSFIPDKDKLRGAFEFNTDLFDTKTIETLNKTYFYILEQLISSPQLTLDQIDLVEGRTLSITSVQEENSNVEKRFNVGLEKNSEEDSEQVGMTEDSSVMELYLKPENDNVGNRLDCSSSIKNIFKSIVEKYPNNIAISDGENISLTYKQLDDISTNLASKLPKNKPVAIYLNRSLEYIISIISCVKAGITYLPLDPENVESKNKYILEDVQPSIILTNDNYQKSLSFTEIDKLSVNINHLLKENTSNTLESVDNDSIYIIYTSGSTGFPKGVEVGEKSLLNLVNWHQRVYEVNENTRATQIAGVAFDATVWEIFPYITAGATLYIPKEEIKEKPSLLAEYLENNKITCSFIPTPMLSLLLPELKNNTNLKYLLTGGDRLKFYPNYDYNFRIFNHYGPTESTVVTTFGEVEKFSNGLYPSIGKPIDNAEVYILNSQRKLVPTCFKGEIYIGSNVLAKGYYNHSELTKEKFIDNPFGTGLLYRSGDIARFLNDGNIEFIGREDHQVKIRGIRIELAEIEKAIKSCSSVKEVYLKVFEKNQENYLVAYVLSDEKIEDELKTKLSQALLPNIVYVENFELTPNGKIDQSKLLEPDFVIKEREIILPQTELEKTVADLWREVLNAPSISMNDSFFDLGGHSLLAMVLTDKLVKKFQCNFALKDLFNNPTVKNCAEVIEKQLQQENYVYELPVITPDPEHKFEPFNLTEIQQAYLIGRNSKFENSQVSSHAYLEIESENLDIERLEKAVNKVIQRHEMLRTVIYDNTSSVSNNRNYSTYYQQTIKQVDYYKIKVFDLKDKDIDTEKKNIREKYSHELLDYTKAPIFNIFVSISSDIHKCIHISIDAIIADATSMVLLAKEIAYYYDNLDLDLEPLNITFRDYLITENSIKDSWLYKKSEAYWKNRVQTIPSAPQLPMSDNRLNNPKFNRLQSRLNADTWSKLKSKAEKIGVTPTIILLSSFSKILSLWSKNRHFTLNLTLFNRLPLHNDVSKLIGDFTSLNLLEINYEKYKNFADACKQIQSQLWEDIDNRAFSGVSVVRELTKERGLENALMPIVFTSMLGESFPEKILGGKLAYSITQTPQVWLDHQVAEIDNELSFNWDYPENLYPQNMLEDMFETYKSLLNNLAKDDSTWNKDLFVRVNDISKESNNTNKEISNKLLHQLFFEQCQKTPKNIAITTSKEKLTYEELAIKVNNLASNLKIEKNEIVAVLLDKSIEQVISVLAILSAGGVYLPIDPTYPQERINYLIETCNVKTVIDNDFISNNILENSQECSTQKYIQSIDDLAYIIFTSGSTGNPKGVMTDHKGAVNTILDINERFNITEQDKVFALSALNFDLSVYDIFGTLAIGASIVIPDSDSLREPSHWLDLINNEKVTVWNSVPALMRMLVEYSKGNESERNFRSIKTVMLSGDWIPTSLPQEIKKYTSESTNVISLGGATEASIWSIYHYISEEDYTKPSIPYGKPLANQKFYVLNSNYESCPCYVTGDLYIGGIGLALGYWKDQEKTNNSFVINPITQERIYKTGDLGRYLPDGSIEFMGRADTQVKIQGFRIELGEIESALTSIDSIENAIVKVFGDKFKDKYLVAYIQPIKALYSTSNLIDEIKEKLSSKLPHYMIPSIFELVENFSLTTNGKVDRNSLKEPKKEVSTSSKSSNSKLVIQISNMVKEILNINEIDEESDLLSLGANSIDIVRLANLLESEFGFCPKVGDIFRLRTIKLLSEFYEANSSKIKNKVIDIPDTLILDPKEREAFKNSHFNISNISGETINLQNIENIDEYSNYKTTRVFSDKIISLSDFSKYLSSLALVKVNDIYKSMYGSAGSLYPVQIYIQVRENRIENIKQGLYYYNQYENKLVLISKEDNLNKNIHFYTNIDIYETSGFSIFLVGYMKSIEPIYSSSSLDYCLIEAGSITQLLRMKAPDYNLGICSIGQVDNEKVIKEAKLSDKHVVLHTLLVGSLDENQTNETWSFVIEEDSDDDWEEITI